MLAKTRPEPIANAVDEWLMQFERALAEPGTAALGALFHPDSHWRDLLALTWTIDTIEGARRHRRGAEGAGRGAPSRPGFGSIRTAPRPAPVTRAGTAAIEAIFRFETARAAAAAWCGSCRTAGGAPKAWTLLTALDELKGHEETVGRARPTGQSYSRDFRGPNWLDLRQCLRRLCRPAIRRCWWSAAARPGFRSRRGSRNCRSTR